MPGERTQIAELPHLRGVLSARGAYSGECPVPGERTQIAVLPHLRAVFLLG